MASIFAIERLRFDAPISPFHFAVIISPITDAIASLSRQVAGFSPDTITLKRVPRFRQQAFRQKDVKGSKEKKRSAVIRQQNDFYSSRRLQHAAQHISILQLKLPHNTQH